MRNLGLCALLGVSTLFGCSTANPPLYDFAENPPDFAGAGGDTDLSTDDAAPDDLGGDDLTGADLLGADLAGIDLQTPADLSTALPDLTGPLPGHAITVTPSSLIFTTSGSAQNIAVKNAGSATLHNVKVALTGTTLDGKLTCDHDSCATLASGATCTFVCTPGSTIVDATTVHATDDETDSEPIAIQILGIGSTYSGGTVFAFDVMSRTASVVSASQGSLTWGPNTTTGATSTADGAANTQTIIVAEGSLAPAAFACTSYMGGNTPGWYLPASGEATAVYTALNLSGFWTSTETGQNTAYINGAALGPLVQFKGVSSPARCVLATSF